MKKYILSTAFSFLGLSAFLCFFAYANFDIKSDAKVDPSYQFVGNKIALTPGDKLTETETDIANRYLAPLLAQKGYQIVPTREGNDLVGWAGVKFQTDTASIPYATLNFYVFRVTPYGIEKNPIIDAFAAKKINRIDREGLIRELCIEIVKKIPDSRR